MWAFAARARIVPNSRATLFPHISTWVLPGTTIHTDELTSYKNISLRGHRHQTCNHSKEEYVSRYGATVNNLEGFWSVLKRAIHGTHIHVSPKHLPNYLGEFE